MSTKAKPRKAFGTLRDFGNHCFGGGGGNRTPVRKSSTKRSTYLVLPIKSYFQAADRRAA